MNVDQILEREIKRRIRMQAKIWGDDLSYTVAIVVVAKNFPDLPVSEAVRILDSMLCDHDAVTVW